MCFHNNFFKIIFFVFLFQSTVSARWMKFDEAASVVKHLEIHHQIAANRLEKIQVIRRVLINKESARTELGLGRLNYNPESWHIQKIEAATINKGKKIQVLKKNIESKSLAAVGPGFDTQVQVTIAYPQVEIGSELELKVNWEQKKESIPGYYSSLSSPDPGEAYVHYEETWDSEVDLFSEAYDTEGYLSANISKRKIKLKLNHPAFKRVVEEEHVLLHPKNWFWFGVSNINSWNDFPAWTLKVYEKVIESKLPDDLNQMTEQVALIQDPTEQIDALTSKLADRYRYVGDWRSVHGAYHPYSLAQISSAGYGDCKNLSTVVAAMLRHLGYTARIAWVSRGVDFEPLPFVHLPFLQVNHAIVFVQKNSQVWWVDPTNPASFAKGIPHDIAARPALILQPTSLSLNQVSEMKPEQNQVSVNLKLKLSEEQSVQGSGDFELTGYNAFSLAGADLSGSKENLKYSMASWVSGFKDIGNFTFPDFDLSSRQVKDFKTTFSFVANWDLVQSSGGPGLVLESMSSYRDLMLANQGRVSGLSLGHLFQRTSRIQLFNRQFVINKNMNCSGESKWFDFSRSLSSEDNGNSLTLVDNFKLKQSKIYSEELLQSEFKLAQKKLRNCQAPMMAIFSKAESSR